MQEEKPGKEQPITTRKTCCNPVSETKAVDRNTCPYCGVRFLNPVELLQHVFHIHGS